MNEKTKELIDETKSLFTKYRNQPIEGELLRKFVNEYIDEVIAEVDEYTNQ